MTVSAILAYLLANPTTVTSAISTTVAIGTSITALVKHIRGKDLKGALADSQATTASIIAAIELAPIDRVEKDALKQNISSVANAVNMETTTLAPAVQKVVGIIKDIQAQKGAATFTDEGRQETAVEAVAVYKALTPKEKASA